MIRRQGFTLVEVMIAAALVVFVAAGALTLFAHGRRAYRSAEIESRLEETARSALDLLAFEVRMAGYLGRQPPGGEVAGATPVGTAAPAGLAVSGSCVDALAIDLEMPLAGADGDHAAVPGVRLRCQPVPDGRSVPGSDTLVVRRVSASPTRAVAGRLQVESTRRSARLFADGVLELGATAQVNDLEVSAFYVSADATGQPGIPSLRRKRLVGGGSPSFQDEELVAGVADLQVEFMPREDGYQRDASFAPLDALVRGQAIRAVRLWVLVQSDLPEPMAGPLPALSYANRTLPASTSRHRRRAASRVVDLRNAMASP